MATITDSLSAARSGLPDATERLRAALHQASHALPVQGPIGVFVHHNTLHAFQHLPFERAVLEAGAMFGAEPYMREDAYRSAIASGRIKESDIDDVLNREPNRLIFARLLDSRTLRKRMLVPGIRQFKPAQIEWALEEEGLADTLRPDLPKEAMDVLTESAVPELAARRLFAECQRRVSNVPLTVPPRTPARPRDLLLARHDVDIDQSVNPLLIRLCGVFLDQGLAYWSLPRRHEGLYVAVRDVSTQPGAVQSTHLQGLAAEFRRQADRSLSSEEAVIELLAALGVNEGHWGSYLAAELLSLPGWAGLIRRLESEPSLAPYLQLPCRLMDYLAVRLTMVLVAARSVNGGSIPKWIGVALAPEASAHTVRLCKTAELFDAAQLVGLSGTEMSVLSDEMFRRFQEEVESFDAMERRRVLHLAYENRHDHQVLGPLAAHFLAQPPSENFHRPSAQVFCCIDDREESIRRHLEEVAPDMETFAYAGFFSVAMDYAGIDDSLASPLCPVIVTPTHAVREQAVAEDHHVQHQRLKRRRLWSRILRHQHVSPRTFVRGWITSLLGVASLVPLVSRVLVPREYGRMREWFNGQLFPQPRTEVTVARGDASKHDVPDGMPLGFTEEEQADRVENVLRPAGLIHGFSRLVVTLGHGSTSINNPHESAYDCGACGGKRGGPNARLFARMANHPGVRRILRQRGLALPDDTYFLGGYHDTCSDRIELSDLDLVPATHREDVSRAKASLDRARELDAHERTRRFEAASLNSTPADALRHVEERAEHLAEPRSEWGHATNAVCIVGRRALTRGLFLDRRAFLVSYNAHQDPDNNSLAKLLASAVPVCAGVNLEYYFSYVDNEKYGSGTKLPHNVTGLVGVMNGPSSDLRTGLPWQTVDIHEPVRILFVIESTPERVAQTFRASGELTEFLENRWIRLATVDPDDGRIHIYRGPHFEEVESFDEYVPVVESSPAWYKGRREHLALARIVGHRSVASAA